MRTYLDNNATTSISPEVLDSMMPFLTDRYQNAMSAGGATGGLRRAVGEARARVAKLLDIPDPLECVFTSGATESNNWAIEGTFRELRGHGHIITTEIEHPSVIEAVRRVERDFGWTVSVLKPDSTGVISADAVLNAVCPATRLISVMLANNETGIIQPVGAISRAVKSLAPAVTFHSDITQAVGKIPVNTSTDLDMVDLLSLSAHKFHGPKGVGALAIRAGTQLASLLVGGGQESGRRSGTVNVPGIVGCGVAAIAAFRSAQQPHKIEILRNRFEKQLLDRFPDAFIVGREQKRLPNTSCFALPGQDASVLADKLALMDVWVGTGSACSSGALRPPNSLLAMGLPYKLAASSLRVSLSTYSSDLEIDRLLEGLSLVVAHCRMQT